MIESKTLPIATLVRRFRLSAGFSQEELAERSGLSARAISDIERGLRPTPRLETIRMLSSGLGLTVDQHDAFLVAARPELRDQHDQSRFTTTLKPSAATNLPIPPTRLIGGAEQVEDLVSLLQSGNSRLITLTGPGGVGKTRLGLEVARRAAPAFSDGAHLIDLAPVSDYTQVASTIARALGLS